MAPVAGAIEPDALRAVYLHHVDGARGRALRLRVERDARPEAGIENDVDRVFLDMVDDDARRIDARIFFQDIDDEPRALPFVLEVRSVDKNHLAVLHRELHMLLENHDLVPAVFVQPDFADAEHVGPVEKRGNHRQHLVGQREILSLLGIEAKPRKVRQAELRGAARLVIGQLAEVVAETLGGTAIKAGPERRFAHRAATGCDHRGIVVRDAADHVGVRLDVTHRKKSAARIRPTRRWPIFRPPWRPVQPWDRST